MRAVVIGASGGIGGAITAQLRGDGWDVTTLSRRDDGFDVTDPSCVQNALSHLNGPFDLIVVAVGILAPPDGTPEKSLQAIDAAHMARLFAVNAIGPALILRHAAALLPKERRGVVAVLSARVGSIGDNNIGGWYSYRASKAALNQITHGAAIELTRSHPQSLCVALHPGTVATDFTAQYAAHHKTVPATQAAQNILAVLNGLTPARTGGFYDYRGDEIAW